MDKRIKMMAMCFIAVLFRNEAKGATTENVGLSDPSRFGAYGDSYGLYRAMTNSGWAEDDEWALRAHYSFGYLFVGREKYELLFTYTGEFDFYVHFRESSPVINRISNPALHLRLPLGRSGESNAPKVNTATAYGRQQIDIGIEHESDGQVVEVTSPAEVAAAQVAYATKDRYFFDQISRGSNFVSVTADLPQHYEVGRFALPFSVTANLRLYFSQDNTVTWGPLANRDTKLSDYHLGSIAVRRNQGRFGTFEAKWTMGARGFATESFDLGWYKNSESSQSWSLPLYIRLHHGPLNTLSNYSQRQDSIGIGLKFASR